MKKIFIFIVALLLSMNIFAKSIADVTNRKCSIDEYIIEYRELSEVKQVEKFKNDCKIIAQAITIYGAYYAVITGTDIIDADNGFATYAIKFELKDDYQISDWVNFLDKIKDAFPSLSNTHFTPYDCSHLLPEKQYFDKNEWIAISRFWDTRQDGFSLSVLEKEMLYIQFYIEHNNETYKSGARSDSDDFLRTNDIQRVIIKIPSDAKLENIKAKVRCTYGSFSVYSLLDNTFDVILPKNTKAIQSDMTVLTQEQYQQIEKNRHAKEEAEKRKQKEIAEQERKAEEARLAKERRIEEERIAAEKRKEIEKYIAYGKQKFDEYLPDFKISSIDSRFAKELYNIAFSVKNSYKTTSEIDYNEAKVLVNNYMIPKIKEKYLAEYKKQSKVDKFFERNDINECIELFTIVLTGDYRSSYCLNKLENY